MKPAPPIDRHLAIVCDGQFVGGIGVMENSDGKVLEKCGFQLEGRLRGAVTKDGKVTDELIYGRLAGDGNN